MHRQESHDKAPVTTNGEATAFVQRSENLSARCGSPRNMLKNIKFPSYSMFTTFLQRPYIIL